MPRNLYGNSLPSVAESRDSDIFYDINTGKSYVFDNGQWNELPQSTPSPAGPTIPQPAAGDAGKVLKVGEDLSYELGEGGGGGGDLPEPTIADAGKVLGVNDQGKYALVEGGGGGSEIPTPTGADIDNFLAVKQTGVSNPQTIASEQTITFGEDGTAQIVTSSLALFVENAGVKATIDNTVYYAHIVDDPELGLIADFHDTNGDFFAELHIMNNTLIMFDLAKTSGDTETIKIEIGDVELGLFWQKGNK